VNSLLLITNVILSGREGEEAQLVIAFFEMLQYIDLLEDPELNAKFSQRLIEVTRTNEVELAQKDAKCPGASLATFVNC
jgi:hypothetical protein